MCSKCRNWRPNKNLSFHYDIGPAQVVLDDLYRGGKTVCHGIAVVHRKNSVLQLIVILKSSHMQFEPPDILKGNSPAMRTEIGVVCEPLGCALSLPRSFWVTSKHVLFKPLANHTLGDLSPIAAHCEKAR
jgi:hypothetical protein